MLDGIDILAEGGSHLILTDGTGQEYQPYIRDIAVETTGPLRVTLKVLVNCERCHCCFGAFCCPSQLLCREQSGRDADNSAQSPRSHAILEGCGILGTRAQYISRISSLHVPMRASACLSVLPGQRIVPAYKQNK